MTSAPDYYSHAGQLDWDFLTGRITVEEYLAWGIEVEERDRELTRKMVKYMIWLAIEWLVGLSVIGWLLVLRSAI